MYVDDVGARPLSRRERRLLAGSERNLRDDHALCEVARRHRGGGTDVHGQRRARRALGGGIGAGCALVTTTGLLAGPVAALGVAALVLLVLFVVVVRRTAVDPRSRVDPDP